MFMSLFYRTRRVAKILVTNTTQTVRGMSKKVNISKSSAHRLKTSYKKRVASVGHEFFETERGHEFLRRLFLTVLLVFGIKMGVGAETMSLFFSMMLLTAYIPSSPSTLGKEENKLRELVSSYGDEMMKKVLGSCQDKPLHLGADETFFDDKVFLLLMELQSGFIFTEQLHKDRQRKTWISATQPCLSKLTNVLSLAMDKGQSLLALGKTMTSAIVTMDLFHFLQDITRAFGAQFSAKHRSLDKQAKRIEQADDTNKIEQQRNVLMHGEKQYKNSLFRLSVMCHPFMSVVKPQSSEVLKGRMCHVIKKLRNIMKTCGLNDKRHLINRAENRLEMLTRLNDGWHQWVLSAVQTKTTDTQVQQWATQYLLPWCYWQWQLQKSKRNPEQKTYYQKNVDLAYQHLLSSPLTERHLNNDWQSWAFAMAKKYQRTTSTVEGRNAQLSYHYFSSKGIREHHIKPLTVIHNFWLQRDDGSTACERLCQLKPPELIEWLLEKMEPMPVARPRRLVPIAA